MDFNWLILALAAVVLLSYLFDVFGRKVRFPSVILLIGCGIGLRLALDSVDLEIPFLSVLLPVIGTLGLILIVLEGALDLKLTREKSGLIGRALTSATLGILVTGGLIAWAMHWHFDLAWQRAWLYAIALSVVSSAVVIPAASALRKADREFVIYESSISDIVGVLLFYAVLEHSGGFAETSLLAVGQIVVSIFVGFIFGVALYWLIHRSTHHVRFLPMIFGIAMLYAAGKLMNLAPLVMVVVVGLLLNNHEMLRRNRFLNSMYDGRFGQELETFKHLTAEFTFVVRTFFFVLLGYSTRVVELLEPAAWALAGVVFLCIMIPRAIMIRMIVSHRLEPLVWFAPRGLITILLFLSIPSGPDLPQLPEGMLMLVVLLTVVGMTIGAMRAPSEPSEPVVDAIETGEAEAALTLDSAPLASGPAALVAESTTPPEAAPPKPESTT